MTDAQCRQAIKLYHEGWGCRNIARMIGTTENSVRELLRGRKYHHITGGKRIMHGKRPGKKLAIYQ